MRKKSFIICGIAAIAVCAIIIAVVFMLPDTNNSTSIDGTWKIVSRNQKPTDDEYIQFYNGVFSYFTNNSGKADITSKYSQRGTTLKIDELSHKYSINSFTKNYVELREQDTNESWKIIRCQFKINNEIVVEQISPVGEWNVVMHAGNTDLNEKLVFTENELQDYRDGNESPTLTGSYSVSGNIIKTDLVEGDVYYCLADSNTLMFIQLSDNYVWELTGTSK